MIRITTPELKDTRIYTEYKLDLVFTYLIFEIRSMYKTTLEA